MCKRVLRYDTEIKMTIKNFIRLLIPPIVFKIKDKTKPKPKPKLEIKLQESPLPQIKHNSDKIIIIGNGPSLNKSVELYKEEILKNDRICVNFFGSSDLYEELKPNIYVFADPAFFWSPDNQKESMEKLFDCIVLKTTWPMQIIVPLGSKGAPMETKLLKNPNITICFFNNVWQDIGNMQIYEAWNKNLLIPHYQNVLNVGLYLSLFWNYKESYLIGADSSSLEDIRVDQSTNELFSIDRHFYSNKSVYDDKNLFDEKRGRIRSDWTLHDYIYAFGKMFEDYYELKKYADYKGLKVYNASEYSWINCFERKKLK